MDKLPVRFLALLVCLLLGIFSDTTLADERAPALRLGVLVTNGEDRVIDRWQATATRLSRALQARDVILVPLDYDQVEPAVAAGSVDLLLSDPATQVSLETRFGINRLATLQIPVNGRPQGRFGAVVFTRSRRFSVESLEDLQGLRLAAVDRHSLGGFLSARLELRQLGIEPYSDLLLHFKGSDQAVVETVSSGEADAGVVRTGVLEDLAAQGKLDLDEVRVLRSPKAPADFPAQLSTRLYPEWGLAALPHLDHRLNRRIVGILQSLDADDAAALDAGISGWIPPVNNHPVHELLRQLELPPYTGVEKTEDDLGAYISEHLGWIVALVLAYLAIAYTAGRAIRDNRQLTAYQRELLDTMYKAEDAQRELMHRMQQLYESERRFTTLAESAPDAIVMIDDQGRVQFWNPAAEQVFGYTANEVRGQVLHELLAPPEMHQVAEVGTRHFTQTGQGTKIGTTRELPAVHKNGAMIPIELSLAAVRADGKWNSIGIMRDITERKQHQAQMEQQIERADLFFNRGGALMVMLDEQGRVRRINETALEVIGLDEETTPGLPWFDLIIAPGDRARMRDAFRRAVRGDADAFQRDTSQILAKEGGQSRWIAWHNVVLPAEYHPDRVLCTGLDVTPNLSLKRELESTRASFSNVVMRNRTGILVLDANGRVQFSNPAAQRSLGRTEEDLRNFTFGVPSLQGGSELQILLPDGRVGIAEVTASQTEWDHNPAYLVMIHDVTDRKAAEEHAQYLAQHDTLTGLPNRSLLLDRLNTALSRANRTGTGLAILFLDLDRFKQINDTLGHRVGDQLLQAVAKQLQRHLRDSDTVARLGGDEFVVLLEGLDNLATAKAVATKIRTSFEEPLIAGDREVSTKPSIGIAAYPDHGDDTGTLMRLADAAMYHAKRHSVSGVSVYAPDMALDTTSDSDLAGPLASALDNREFALHYQPQFRLDDESPIGFEALLRWQHPEKGLIPPGGFVYALEDAGLICRVGEWVIKEVLGQIREWSQRGLPELPVAINISVLQLEDPEFVSRLGAMLEQAAIAPRRLRLELTESALMKNFESAQKTVLQLDALDVGLHLDDFGTGYSSLALLDRLPFDTVKIDRNLISGLPGDPHKTSLVQGIIGLTRELGMTVLAEGVETRRQAEFLIRNQCDLAQGFLFARPMSRQDSLDWLSTIQPPAKAGLR